MKKLLIGFLLLLIVLAGCGNKIHKEVNQGLAKDSFQIIDIIQTAMDDNTIIEDMDPEKTNILLGYKEKYEDTEDPFLSLSEVDKEIITSTFAAIGVYANSSLLDSDKDRIKEHFDAIKTMAKKNITYEEYYKKKN